MGWKQGLQGGLLLAVAVSGVACTGAPASIVYVYITETPSPTAALIVPTVLSAQPLVADATLNTRPAQGNVCPTPTTTQIQVAEQVFEHGRMFWLQPTREVWVLIQQGNTGGLWLTFEDTFVEGQRENDPSLTPPDGQYQPQRGFGKLWREQPDLRQQLGWAITPEFGYISAYVFRPATVDADKACADQPGVHTLNSLHLEQFLFDEATRTWRRG